MWDNRGDGKKKNLKKKEQPLKECVLKKNAAHAGGVLIFLRVTGL
ncbi:hypothetical protein [Kerstersia sp.]